MNISTQEALLSYEEKIKEEVYSKFDQMTSSASSKLKSKLADVSKGAYDDQESFMVYGALSEAQRDLHNTTRLVGKLYDIPYFAHVVVSYDDDLESENDFFLSDCESLDEAVSIRDNGTLLPFKQDPKRPLSGALFHCYQAKKGDPISYKGPHGNTIYITPHLICNTEIWRRKLQDAISLYPMIDLSQITADELLELKLQENRNNPTLRNIISTLQRMQFEIIETDVDQSFVVQGCAGSGKSQCMLHRLFYLRDVLAEDGWDKVLLLTPTKLFRQYSADLIRRYQLSDIYDCSIADLYKLILSAYDERFKDRQYVYELTEEYLPDEYLFDVYDYKNVSSIEEEIHQAITSYVKAGCDVLSIDMPDKISHIEIDKIIADLEEQMEKYDAREESLQDDQEYKGKRNQYEQLVKDIEVNRRRLQRYHDELTANENHQEKLESLEQAVQEAEKERADWIDQRNHKYEAAIKELDVLSRKVERGTDIQAPAKYAHQIFILRDMVEGKRYQEDEEYLEFLNEYCQQVQEDLLREIGDKKLNNVKRRSVKRREEIEENISRLSAEIAEKEDQIEILEEWLRNAASKIQGEEVSHTLLRTEMERARYFLSRIESTVFEREVWKALAPVKEKYHIQTIKIEELSDGKRKESRILYKSDLLFYVKIYMELHPDAQLPEYGLICIDEGQDLHQADYDILHGLYPDAAFNVFGDVDQVLHSACGIHDWAEQAGIDDVRELSTNYRNTASIVDFCNSRFGIHMNYVGSVVEEQKPRVLSSVEELKGIVAIEELVVIVRDRSEYEEFCRIVNVNENTINYMDTTSEKSDEDIMECYSIYAAKGLEFKNVLVYAHNMTKNQKVVACTRAMGGLYYYE